MLTLPPYRVSYTAPGHPLHWESPRPAQDTYFPFVKKGKTIEHWPDFCDRETADQMLGYVRALDGEAQLFDVLHEDSLPPDVGRYPTPVQAEDHVKTVSVYVVVGKILANGSPARVFAHCGGLADLQGGLRAALQSQYLSRCGTTWNDAGQIVSGQNAWPWDTLYAYASPEFAGEAQLYWGNSLTGPVLR